MSVDIVIPQIGESITHVFIARWLKEPGQAVAEGESLLEVDSDKASMEIPSPTSGVVTETLAEEGDEVEIGAVIARIKEGAAPAASAPAAEEAAPAAPSAGADVKAGPAARHAAQEAGVDLNNVTGTGPRGRIVTEDIANAKAPAAKAPAAAKPEPVSGGVERVAMSPLRRTIARRLVEAQQTAAMLTTFNEVDMGPIMAFRKEYQDLFVKKNGIKLGFMSFFVKAAVAALQEFPAVNAEVDGTDILYKRYYNIGVAVSGPKGLMVPVLRHADQLSMAEVEQGIADLAVKARDSKLRISDFEDGTFTISNGGVFGSMMSTPILNPPQVGILGMHNIVKRPIVDPKTGEIRAAPMMYLALSYDHRIIDGKEAVSFLVRIKQIIEDPRRLLIEV